MALDPELMKQLIQVFRSELDEKLQSLTDGLLLLEKGLEGAEYNACLDALFRDAHNIKGAARGVDVPVVAAIAHSLETLFGLLRRDQSLINGAIVTLCLQSLDHMREAMAVFDTDTALSFDLDAFIKALDQGAVVEQALTESVAPSVPKETSNLPIENEMTRVSLDKLNRLSALVEDLLSTKIEMQDHLESVQLLDKKLVEFSKQWSSSTYFLSQRPQLEQNLAGIASLAKINEGINTLSSSSQHIYKQLNATNIRINHLSEMLENQVRLMRMVPMATLLRPLARSVRDIAQELGKKIDYKISGDEIEIDRPILEGLKDPLVHLLRNAIDHGIEIATDRRAKGKSETGCIHIHVTALGNRIILSIQDDGDGISVDRITEVAIKKNILSAAEIDMMSREEKLNVIFRPGFSSKEIITNVSGRGVGLDVVLSRVNEMKGLVKVDTDEGKGTTFTLSFPLTLSTDRGLMVKAGGTCYAIPTSVVTRVMEINASDLVDIQAGKAVMLDSKAIPAFELARLLELKSAQIDTNHLLSIVIITKDWKNIALFVEEIIGEREIVIKRLQSPLISVRNVAGGSLAGNGEVMVVLNPTDLINSAMLHHSTLDITHETAPSENTTERKRVLIVDDSITTRTLEKNILEAHGYLVTSALDGLQGWEALNQGVFDLVVTDVEMPGLDGFQLAERIKTSEAYSNIPVVIVTSLANETDKRRGIAVGADAYIVKGQFETKVLLDVIHQLI